VSHSISTDSEGRDIFVVDAHRDRKRLGVGNTAVGAFSLFSLTIGDNNTAVGAGALDLNKGDSNTAVGAAALLLNVFGTQNTAVGTAALENNASGNNNTANGAFAPRRARLSRGLTSGWLTRIAAVSDLLCDRMKSFA
jgi:hypothetical protein